MGWLLLGLGLSVPWSDVLDGYVDQGVLARPGSLPSPSRRWRWWARALGAAPVVFLLTVALLSEPLDPTYVSVANPLGLPGGLAVEVPLLAVNVLAGAVVLLTVPVACVSLVVRFRHAGSSDDTLSRRLLPTGGRNGPVPLAPYGGREQPEW